MAMLTADGRCTSKRCLCQWKEKLSGKLRVFDVSNMNEEVDGRVGLSCLKEASSGNSRQHNQNWQVFARTEYASEAWEEGVMAQS